MPQQNAACNACPFYATSERCINGLSPKSVVMWLALLGGDSLSSAFTNNAACDYAMGTFLSTLRQRLLKALLRAQDQWTYRYTRLGSL